MPNRIIKEAICRSDSIDSLSWFEEVLFYRLIVVCDDYGRFDGRPAVIRGACFPLKDIRLDQIENALRKLSTAGMIWRYEIEDRAFLQLITWERHQQIRAAKSKYPAPNMICNQLISSDINGNQEISNDISGNLTISSDINGNQEISNDINCSRNRNRERNRNRKREECAPAIKPVERFEDFWDTYPNKQRRYLAEKAYCDLLLSGVVTEDQLVLAATNYAAYIKDSGDKMFLPNNFLEKCVFKDYLEVKPTKMPKKGREERKREAEPEEELVGEDEEWWKYGPNGWEG